MKFGALLLLLLSANLATAQLTEKEEKNIDQALDELCTCFNSILSTFDSRFQDAFQLSLTDQQAGKAAIQEYFLSLDSARKHTFKKEIQVRILNPDSELTKCGKVVHEKYGVSVGVASSEQKKYIEEKLNKIQNCGVMSKMILQSGRNKP
jgi:hypothetical protein